ncbi:tiggrin [Scaptodrosophila lebanonensis]|uniref:Tiggrin n=1 Tax=Drosophila lebanonensis TaxID=7225 RepID=A0A6J2TNW4_DROLE|nr:tiggrin [Scaptodrosophila lebanonensis]
MRAFGVCCVLLLALTSSWAFSAYQRGGLAGYTNGYQSQASYSSGYSSSSSSSSSLGSSSAGYGGAQLRSHSVEVVEFANRLKQEFNQLSRGINSFGIGTSWSSNILQLTGKSSSELNALSRQITQQLVSDMNRGAISYTTIAQPNFFESKAAEVLDQYTSSVQHTLDISDHGQPLDLSKYDEVKNYAYPTEIKVVNGKTYMVHRNCTEATKITPSYSSLVIGGANTGAALNSGFYAQGPSTTTITRKNTVYNWEPSVVGYRPVVTIDGLRGANTEINAPTSQVVITRVNKTINRNADGTNSVAGSQSQQRWVDGKLVFDSSQPFGQSTGPSGNNWEREEREHLFWFLNQGATSPQRLEAWQRQQEDRLSAMALRHHTSVEAIEQFHRRELERYQQLLRQYQTQSSGANAWQRLERGRLDWLIHQNSLSVHDFERWQRENSLKLNQLAQQYRITPAELQNWQREELQRIYVYFNNINNSMAPARPAPVPLPGSASLVSNEEQQRLNELIRQHNETIAMLQNSIQTDQQKLRDLSVKYQGNVQDMEKWLKEEVARISGLIREQTEQMSRITEWQRSERTRLESILRQHQGSVTDLEQQMARDRNYLQGLASKYHVTIEELEKWQRTELQRLQREGQQALESNIKEWQLREREHLKNIVSKNELTLEEFQTRIVNDRARLEQLARTYKVQVTEIEDWIKSEMKKFQSEGLLKEVEKELALWQQRERERLQHIVQQSSLTVEQLEQKIKNDQTHFYELANTYQIRVEDIQDWLKKELLRLQSEGLIKAEALKDWQQAERNEIMRIVQQNKYSIEDFEKKVLADRRHLQELSKQYNVQVHEIEHWIKSEGERLQREGQLHMEEQLNNWQKIERQRLLDLINKNNLSIEELEARIKKDQVHLYSLAQQHQVRVEEIEEWIKQQIAKLQADGVIEMQKLKDWQLEWRGNLTNMVQERDFTVEEFHKWLLEDRARLQHLAMQHNVQIEEIEQFVKHEEQRFVSMGLLKPYEKLTNWQEVERMYLNQLAQQQYKSTEQLEERLRQDRELLEKMARQYSVQVEEIEKWMKQELARLRDEGQLQIDNLTTWQLAERERLEALVKQNKQWSVEEFEAALRNDREHMQTIAFQHHTSVEEIERWVQSEIERLKKQGKLDIEQLTMWQKAEQQRILSLLQQQSSITVEEFEEKVQRDRLFLVNLADQYHVSVVDIEAYIKKVIEDLRKQGQFEIEKLQTWQLVERDYIKQLIAQYNNGLSTSEYEQKLREDRVHLNQLADQYRISVEQIEQWMITELKRLRGDTETQLQALTTWQKGEVERLQKLLQQQNHLSYVEFEIELQQERKRLEQLAQQYSLSVVEIEEWLRQQLVNLKTTGQIKVENLTKWQAIEQQRLIELLLKQQQDLSYKEFEQQLQQDRAHLRGLSQTYHVSVEQIEQWMRDELARLKNSGLVHVEELTNWQTEMRKEFNVWLQQQQNGATYNEFLNFLKRDKERLSTIAQEYHITVEEVEKWVQKEAARLSLIGVIERPEDNVTYEEIIKVWRQDNAGSGSVINSISNNEQRWKQQAISQLRGKALVRPMTWQEFEIYLVENRPAFEQLARQYNITVEEVIVWLNQSAKKLVDEGLITGTITVEEWQLREKQYVKDLINQQLRNQQKWTIEELELKLLNDQKHLAELIRQYNVTIEELQAWYRRELKELLDQRKISPGNRVEWKTLEKERIYLTAVQHPGTTRVVLEELLLGNKMALQRLALTYRITVEELTLFIRQELRRLADLGLIIEGGSDSQLNNRWQEEERARLRTIASTITITRDELLEFISNDNAYQKILSNLYRVSLDKLAPYQRIAIDTMQREGLFQELTLNQLQPWQKLERDRLYEFIRNQNFTLRNLKEWQRQDVLLNEFALKYGISVYDLKAWQLREFQRIIDLAQYYQMSLIELQEFRDNELRYLTYVIHKKTSPIQEIQSWERNEAARSQILQRKSGLSGQQLLEWRRTLYLLSQGLIDLNTGGSGGQIVDNGSTNATFVPKPIFSKDRGDQPPNAYEETFDEDEPGLEGETKKPLPVPAPIRSTPAPFPYPTAVPQYPSNGGAGADGGFVYRKKEYQFTVPVGTASAAASATPIGTASSASASVGSGFDKWGTGSLTRSVDHHKPPSDVEDFGQQQQVELGWNGQLVQVEDEDGGQQVQVEETDWNGGQQQQVEEDVFLGQKQVEDLSDRRYGSGLSSSRQQPLRAVTQATVEVQTSEEPKSTWGKFKDYFTG